jgi:restriction system protein
MAVLAFQEVASGSGENDQYHSSRSESLFSGYCPFCSAACRIIREDWVYDSSEQHDLLAVCVQCGWWSYDCDQPQDLSGGSYHYSSRAVLRQFRVEDREAPYEELARYLARHHDRLADVHPAKLEELVAAIYREAFSHRVEFCSYGRPDQGIDVICGRADDGQLFGIQVKRYRAPIELGQIHQFLGALQLAGMSKGVFVATSRYQKGCYEVIKSSQALLGVEIDLVDGRRFLEFLGIWNSRKTHVYCKEWNKSGYTTNYGQDEGIPLETLLKAPLWPNVPAHE